MEINKEIRELRERYIIDRRKILNGGFTIGMTNAKLKRREAEYVEAKKLILRTHGQ